MIDAGVNLCSSQYKNYLSTLIEHAQEAGLTGIISISNGPKEWRANLEYTKNNINTKFGKKKEFKIWTTIGIHPHDAKNAHGERENRIFKDLEKLAQENWGSS